MASISAGESDEEVDRVLMFQAAVQGYAPLLLERRGFARASWSARECCPPRGAPFVRSCEGVERGDEKCDDRGSWILQYGLKADIKRRDSTCR